MTPERCGNILIRRITRQSELYRQLLELSQLQMRALRAGHYEKLPRAVHQREKILDELSSLNRLTTRFRDYWNEHSAEAPAEVNTQIGECLALIPPLLRELTAADAALKEAAQQQLGQIRNDLGRVKRGLMLTTTYTRPRLNPPRFVSRLCN